MKSRYLSTYKFPKRWKTKGDTLIGFFCIVGFAKQVWRGSGDIKPLFVFLEAKNKNWKCDVDNWQVPKSKLVKTKYYLTIQEEPRGNTCRSHYSAEFHVLRRQLVEQDQVVVDIWRFGQVSSKSIKLLAILPGLWGRWWVETWLWCRWISSAIICLNLLKVISIIVVFKEIDLWVLRILSWILSHFFRFAKSCVDYETSKVNILVNASKLK